MTKSDTIFKLSSKNLETPALISTSKVITYGDLITISSTISSQVPPRSLVCLIASNTIEAIAGYVGFLDNDSAVMMLNATIEKSRLQILLETYEPEFLWAPEAFAQGELRYSSGKYNLYAINQRSKTSLNGNLALLLSTSGSTGSPKFVRLSRKNIISNAEAIAHYQHISSCDRSITTLPFSYSFGISIINSHLISGASIVVTEQSIFSRELWTIFHDHKVTNFGGVPYTYAMLKRLRFQRMELPYLRFFSQAGGRLDPTLHEEFAQIAHDKQVDFFVMYGQTEATARITYLPPSHTQEKVGSIGIAIPGGVLKLEDNEGVELTQAATPGELVYIGPNVAMGYASCRSDLANEDEWHSVLHTGDIAQFDEDGYYYIVGRMKRFIKLFGKRVNLDEVESFLTQKGYTVACTGKDDSLCVHIQTGDKKQVIDDVVSLLGVNSSCIHSFSLGTIPRSNTGKILYSCLEK